MGVGKNIENILKKQGIKISDLSKKADVPYGTLHAIIKRDSENVNSNTLQKIAVALEVDADELVWDLKSFEYLDTLRKAGASSIEGFANMMNITSDRCLALLSETETPSVQEREKLQLITGLSFEEFFAPVERDYGTPTDAEQKPLKEDLLNHFDQLNPQGQEKAVESVELLTKVPEYKK